MKNTANKGGIISCALIALLSILLIIEITPIVNKCVESTNKYKERVEIMKRECTHMVSYKNPSGNFFQYTNNYAKNITFENNGLVTYTYIYHDRWIKTTRGGNVIINNIE